MVNAPIHAPTEDTPTSRTETGANIGFDWAESARHNQDVWREISPVLDQSDIDHDLPDWTLIYDARQTETEAKQSQAREVITMTFIDRIFDQMTSDGLNEKYADTPGHPGIDEELRTITKTIICTAQRIRYDQDKRLLTPTEMLMVAYEVWNVDYLHRKRKRQVGGFVSRQHLAGTALQKIRDTRFTNIYSIIAALHHDDGEDLPDLHPKTAGKAGPNVNSEKLLADKEYNFDPLREIGAFEEPEIIANLINRTKDKVFGLVKGVTKWDDEDILQGMRLPEDTPEDVVDAYKDATSVFILLEHTIRYGLRVIALKGADRADNMGTVGVKGPDRAKQIAGHTAHTYMRLLRVFKFDHLAGKVLGQCFGYMNPQALQKAEELREAQFDRFLGHKRELSRLKTALAPIMANPAVEYIRVRPRPLAEMLDASQIEDETYEPRVHPNDPHFEIYIQIKNPSAGVGAPSTPSIEKLKSQIRELSEEATPENPATKAKINQLKSTLREKERTAQLEKIRSEVATLLDTSLRGFDEANPNKSRSSHEAGVEVDIVNRELFEGPKVAPITVRVNDRRSEDRRPRGWLHKEDEELPDFLKEVLTDIVHRTRRRAKRLYIFDALEDMPRDFTVAITPEGEEKVFLRGATPIDFAASIHEEVLGNAMGFVASTGAGRKARAFQMNPLDPLPDEPHQINVVTPDNQEFADFVTTPTPPDLRWLPFVTSLTRKTFRSLLRAKKTDQEEKDPEIKTRRREQGLYYLQHLCGIFNLDEEEALRGLLYGTNKRNFQDGLDRLTYSYKRTSEHLEKLTKARRKSPKKIATASLELRTLGAKCQAAGQKNLNLVTAQIGQAQIEPLEVLFGTRVEQYSDNDEDIILGGINVEIDLPNTAGQAELVGAVFKRWSINMTSIHTDHHPRDSHRIILRTTLEPEGDATLLDLAKAILEIDYRFEEEGSAIDPIRVTSDNFRLLCRSYKKPTPLNDEELPSIPELTEGT